MEIEIESDIPPQGDWVTATFEYDPGKTTTGDYASPLSAQRSRAILSLSAQSMVTGRRLS